MDVNVDHISYYIYCEPAASQYINSAIPLMFKFVMLLWEKKNLIKDLLGSDDWRDGLQTRALKLF